MVVPSSSFLGEEDDLSETVHGSKLVGSDHMKDSLRACSDHWSFGEEEKQAGVGMIVFHRGHVGYNCLVWHALGEFYHHQGWLQEVGVPGQFGKSQARCWGQLAGDQWLLVVSSS